MFRRLLGLLREYRAPILLVVAGAIAAVVVGFLTSLEGALLVGSFAGIFTGMAIAWAMQRNREREGNT